VTNFLQLQEDAQMCLLCSEQLVNVNVVQYRKMRMQSEIDFSALYQTQRNGRGGAGIMVEMPRYETVNPNSPGPERMLLIDLLCVEEPNTNMEPTSGTEVSAEELADFVLEELGDIGIEGIGELYPDRKTITPAQDLDAGLVGYRVTMVVWDVREKRVRVPLPSIAEDAGLVTLTNQAGFEDANIFWTQDGTFPGEANPGAVKYTGPFDASAISRVRWRAYQAGKLGSFVGQVVNPNV
jgi:hypothetical protein